MKDDLLNVVSESCPKAVWVMSTLADDELADGVGELPAGLSFHLSRCASCKALAEKLQDVSRGLNSLSLLEPADELEEQAEAQLENALAHGARLTGRVQIPADDVDDDTIVVLRQRNRFDWSYLAVAAVVSLVTIGIYVSYRPSADGEAEVVHQLYSPPTDADFKDDFFKDFFEEGTTPSHDKSQLVDGDKSKSNQGLLRRHHTHIEAAQADDKGVMQYGVILPDPATRGVTFTPWFDKPAENESNKPFRNDN